MPSRWWRISASGWPNDNRLQRPDVGDLLGQADLAAAGRPVRGAVALEDDVLGQRRGLGVVVGEDHRLLAGDRPAVALADEGGHRARLELEAADIAAIAHALP